MTVIHKVQLGVAKFQGLYMPPNAKIILAREQGDNICLWYSFDNERKPSPSVLRRIHVVYTGEEYPSEWTYLGTAMLMEGAAVIHLFEDK